jgi:hypothetical protein
MPDVTEPPEEEDPAAQKRARKRAGYAANKEDINAKRRLKPRKANPVVQARANKRYYATHRDDERARSDAYYAENKDTLLASRRTSEGRAQYRAWAADRKAKKDAAAAERRAAARARAEARRQEAAQ